MEVNLFFEELKKDRSNVPKRLLLFTVAAVILIILLVVGWRFLQADLAKIKQVKSEVAKQTAAIREYEESERKFVNQYRFTPQPVMISDLETAQSAVIRKCKEAGVDVVSLNNVTQVKQDSKAPPDGYEYELIVMGSWDRLARFVQGFRQQAFLTSIRTIKFEAQAGGDVKTTVKYKIYVE